MFSLVELISIIDRDGLSLFMEMDLVIQKCFDLSCLAIFDQFVGGDGLPSSTEIDSFIDEDRLSFISGYGLIFLPTQ